MVPGSTDARTRFGGSRSRRTVYETYLPSASGAVTSTTIFVPVAQLFLGAEEPQQADFVYLWFPRSRFENGSRRPCR